jgi:hypothetical protein
MTCRILILLILISCTFIIPGTLAGESKVPRDGTVYIGEAELDLSDCAIRNGDEIAWWESGNPQGTPAARARVADVRRFTVDPETFRGHTGMWYGLIGKKPAFKVEEPFLQADLVENGIDTQPDSIKRGNLVSFKISTNLAALSQRSGSSGALISLNLTGPNETEYHTLSSPHTNDFNLDAVYVYASPYDTGAVWDTSDEQKFPDGEYTFSAITNVNRINEVNPESGATYTEKKTYLLGKTEVKPSEKEEEEDAEDSNTNLTTSDESDAKDSDETETTSPKKKTKSELEAEEAARLGRATSEPTPEEPELNSTPDSSQEERSAEDLEEDKTTEPTPDVTEEQTTIATPEPTAEITEEPTPEITLHPTRTPLPRPPGPGASPTKQATPIHPALILGAMISGAIIAIVRRNGE